MEPSNPISDVAKPAGQLAEAWTETIKFIDKIAGGPLQEMGGLVQDSLAAVRERRRFRLMRTIDEARRIHEAKNLDAQQVPDRILVPLLEAGSLSDDDSLSSLWAGLLANAANPNSDVEVRPAFVSIMSELSSLELLILEHTYANNLPRFDDVTHEATEPIWRQPEIDTRAVLRENFGNKAPDYYATADVAEDNLARLGIARQRTLYKGKLRFQPSYHEDGWPAEPEQDVPIHEDEGYQLLLTNLGAAFLIACHPQYPLL